MEVPKLNTFCRLRDLVYVETGLKEGEKILWFLDASNKRTFYPEDEVERQVDACLTKTPNSLG